MYNPAEIRQYSRQTEERMILMWKKICLLGVAVSLLCSAFLSLRLHLEQRALAAGLIRLHVVANSDSPEDQQRKLRVRDAVLPVIAALTRDCESPAQARLRLEAGLPEIRAAAEKQLAGEHRSDPVSVSLTEERFPRRDYETFSLPAGTYEALRVTLGSGGGHNWWCVAFPALCLPATTEEFTEAAAAAGMTADQVELVTEDSERVRLKFRLLDWISDLFG